MDVATNRGNNLLLTLLKYRYPNIYQPEQSSHITNIISKPIERSIGEKKTKLLSLCLCILFLLLATDNVTDALCLSLLMSYISEHGKLFPLEIGADYSTDQKNQLAEYLVSFNCSNLKKKKVLILLKTQLYKHFLDYKSSHCTPLPGEYFQMP